MGFRVWRLGFRGWGLEFRLWSVGFEVWGFELRAVSLVEGATIVFEVLKGFFG